MISGFGSVGAFITKFRHVGCTACKVSHQAVVDVDVTSIYILDVFRGHVPFAGGQRDALEGVATEREIEGRSKCIVRSLFKWQVSAQR